MGWNNNGSVRTDDITRDLTRSQDGNLDQNTREPQKEKRFQYGGHAFSHVFYQENTRTQQEVTTNK